MLVLSNSTDKEKLLLSIWSVNLTQQVQEVWHRVELRLFNEARTLAPTCILLIASVGALRAK